MLKYFFKKSTKFLIDRDRLIKRLSTNLEQFIIPFSNSYINTCQDCGW